MKKILALALVFLLLASMTVAAQITYNTGFMIQNLSDQPANVRVIFYDKNGNQVGSDHPYTIPAGGSQNVFPLPDDIPAGFDGSVVISSDQPVAAVVNELGNTDQYQASYVGFSAGASTVYLPRIDRNNGGNNTWFNVQNAGTAPAQVTVTYTPGVAGSATTETATIPVGAAKTFDQAGNTALGSRFAGSAKVVCTNGQNIVATCNVVSASYLMAYDGFTGGSTELSMPLVNYQPAKGLVTGIKIMNIGSVNTTVTVHYVPAAGIPGNATSPVDETHEIPAGQSVNFAYPFFSPGGTYPTKFVGSGQVTASGNTASQPLVAVVNQTDSTTNKASAYSAFNPASGTEHVSFPTVMTRNGARLMYTGLNVQNVGTSATTVTITFTPLPGRGFATPPPQSKVVQPGETWSLIQGDTFSTVRWVGSAVASVPAGGKIIGVCNEVATSSIDTFMTYEGINY